MQMFAIIEDKKMSLNRYYKLFTAQMEVIKANGGRTGYKPDLYMGHLQKVCTAKGLTKVTYHAKSDEEQVKIQEKATKGVTDKYLACLFLQNAGQEQHGAVRKRLVKDYVHWVPVAATALTVLSFASSLSRALSLPTMALLSLKATQS